MMQRSTIRVAVSTVLLAGGLAAGGLAQEPTDVKEEIEALKEGQSQIRRELAEIKRLLQQQQRAAPARRERKPIQDVVLELGARPVKGNKDARLTIIEFLDYQ